MDGTDKLKELTRKGEYILLNTESFEEYVERLKEELESAENILAGEKGFIPDYRVSIMSKEGTIISMTGTRKYLQTGWVCETCEGRRKIRDNKSEGGKYKVGFMPCPDCNNNYSQRG